MRQRPERPGEFFWGHDVFWIWQWHSRLPRRLQRGRPGALVGATLERPSGTVVGLFEGAERRPLERLALDPVVLAESLREAQAPRRALALDAMPEELWRAVLAAEDHRFFDHVGIEARAIARAMLKNAEAGRVVQGGSTITQQLIKMRDLSPKRTVGRKASEAVRALALEAEYDKEEILEAYLNTVYMGHVGGVAVRGVDAAARAYFGRAAEDLTTPQCLVLAAMIQGPNRLSPEARGPALVERYAWIASRMGELGWLDAARAQALSAAGPPAASVRRPRARLHAPLRSKLAAEVAEIAPERWRDGGGFWVETGIDAHLQRRAEEIVSAGLERLRRSLAPGVRSELQAALVAVQPSTGRVRAYVGGDPAAAGDGFDRARSAERQPGSTVKPLVLLEALQSCGRRAPLHPATRIADRPIEIDAPGGVWRPRNSDDRFRGEVDLRRAVEESLNVPFVHVVGWCGFEATVGRLRPRRARPAG